MNETELELAAAGYQKVYDYSQYSHDNHVNVIPEEAFKRLVRDTFKTITDTLRATYGPYGSSVLISDQSETVTTKDGFNVFQSMGFSHSYKRMVYLAIKKIIERVNRNVGDGTTSCILLAEKIFNNLNEIIHTPDDKRQILIVLNHIEKELQNTESIKEDIENGKIMKLDEISLRNMIRMAANYDSELTEVIYNALDPQLNEDGTVKSVRNVIADADVSLDADSNAMYSFDYMPGDYRIRVDISADEAELGQIRQMRCILYDHAFSSGDWKNFTKNWDKYPTIIIARTFTRGFIDKEWRNYIRKFEFDKQTHANDGDPKVYIATIKGDFVQHELQDLGFLLKTDVRNVHDGEVDHTTLPMVNIQLFKGNCLAFHDCVSNDGIDDYIQKLTNELNKDEVHSYVKEKEYFSRIKAIKMESKDTILTVKCSTSLEAKLIMDKIDDCVSIVNSAMNSGIVPNLLKYAYNRVFNITDAFNPFLTNVSVAMRNAIVSLFEDVWTSKYNDTNNDDRDITICEYYSQYDKSFDIISDKSCDIREFPTSAQYDLEVVVAAISIVKYLLTGRALIFDAHLMSPVNDDGHYQQMY